MKNLTKIQPIDQEKTLAATAALFDQLNNPTDILSAFKIKPKPLDYIVDGFLAGTVGSLTSPGASGKSFLALMMSMAIGSDIAGGDLLDLNIKKHGKVHYFNLEDPEDVLLTRLHAIGAHLNDEARASVASNLDINTLRGLRFNVVDDIQRQLIIEKCKGDRLIIFDTLSRIHQLNENDNGDAGIIMGCLEQIAVQTGAAVLFLHHVGKSAAINGDSDKQQAGRGASLFTDNGRWSGYVVKMTKEEAKTLSEDIFKLTPINGDDCKKYVRFGNSKQNYNESVADRWFKFHEGGVLLPIELHEVPGSKSKTDSKLPVKSNRYDYYATKNGDNNDNW